MTIQYETKHVMIPPIFPSSPPPSSPVQSVDRTFLSSSLLLPLLLSSMEAFSSLRLFFTHTPLFFLYPSRYLSFNAMNSTLRYCAMPGLLYRYRCVLTRSRRTRSQYPNVALLLLLLPISLALVHEQMGACAPEQLHHVCVPIVCGKIQWRMIGVRGGAQVDVVARLEEEPDAFEPAQRRGEVERARVRVQLGAAAAGCGC